MNIGDNYIVTIDKLGNLCVGLAKINDFLVMVDDVCPLDKVKIEITKLTKNYARAKVVELLESSPYRLKPFCPMQKVCGACQLQFIDYDYQLEIKRQVVKETLKKIGALDIDVPMPVPSPQIKNYRHKIQYPITETKNSKRIIAGYYKNKTHEIVNIKYCPIQPKICDDIIDFVREIAPMHKIDGYNEEKHTGLLRHVVIRSSALNGKNLVILVLNSNKIPERIKDFALKLYDRFDDVIGVGVNLNDKKTNLIMTDRTIILNGNECIKEKICNIQFKIGANTFFQVNPKSAENIFRYVKEYISNNFYKPVVLDAYAGISAFGLVISDVCHKVVSVEENEQSVKLAQITKKENKINNIELNCEDSEKFFQSQVEASVKYDAIILDPPRKGCTEKTLEYALKLTDSTIIYVSCNPSTLARDLKYLISKGCTVKSIKPFDMFCHTHHIENVAIINTPQC